jgi:serine/threonine protein kinase
MTTPPDLAVRVSSDRVYDDGPPAHPPGHLLAPGYQVIEHVRRGEDLDCYEAWSSQRYCRCFIKTLRPDCASDPSARRHLQREARLLLSLTHPHLVRAYEYVKPDSAQPPLLVLENLTGATLVGICARRCATCTAAAICISTSSPATSSLAMVWPA